jgi:predicted N-acyltransferase
VAGDYYPKLQSCVPFTPVTGARLLMPPGAPPGRQVALAKALLAVADKCGVSGLHCTFLTEAEAGVLSDASGGKFLTRVGLQYHWCNKDYEDFDGFLADLLQRKRNAVIQALCREFKGCARNSLVCARNMLIVTGMHWLCQEFSLCDRNSLVVPGIHWFVPGIC